MDIEQLKQIEDLKAELSGLHAQLSFQFSLKKDNFIKDVRNDFERFFKDKGFAVTVDSRAIIASYGSLGAALSHEDPKTDFMGSIFSFNLAIKLQDSKKYFIVLKKNNAKSAPEIIVRKAIQNADFEDEVNRLSENIETAKQRLENPESESWSLFVRDETLPTSPKEYWEETFSSFSELLSKITR